MSVVCAITEGHVSFRVHGHQRPCSCAWPVQPPESMLISVVCTTAEGRVCGPTAYGGCVNVYGQGYHQNPGRCLWSVLPLKIMLILVGFVVIGATFMSMACTAAKGHIGVCGLCCARASCWCLWSLLPPETMLKSVAHVDIRSHMDGHSRCFHQISMYPLSMIYAPAECESQENYFCSGINNCRLTVRKS